MPEHIWPADEADEAEADDEDEADEADDEDEVDGVEGVVAASDVCSELEDDDSLACWWLHATRPSAKTAAPKSVFFIFKNLLK